MKCERCGAENTRTVPVPEGVRPRMVLCEDEAGCTARLRRELEANPGRLNGRRLVRVEERTGALTLTFEFGERVVAYEGYGLTAVDLPPASPPA